MDIATLDDPSADFVGASGEGIYALGPGMGGTYSYSPRAHRWIAEHLSNYDLITIHGLWQYHGLATWRAIRDSGKPYLVYSHGMLDPWFRTAYPLKHAKKQLYWSLVERRVLRGAANVLFTCEEERSLARGAFWPYHLNEWVVNYSAEDAPKHEKVRIKAEFLNRFPECLESRFLLFLGRIHPKKGCDLLIESFASSDSDCRLVMAGPVDASYESTLRSLADRFGVSERITWTGMLEGEQKWGALFAADCFVLPSHQENFGIAVAESLAAGLPVLVSDKVNIWREIVDDGAGYVASDSRAGAVELLHRWSNSTEDEKNQLRRNARACYEKRFTTDRSAGSYLEVVTASLGRTKS